MGTGVEGQSLSAQDQLFVLMQAAAYLTATRGSGAPEARICYERAESFSHSLGRPLLLRALIGQWRYTFMTDKLSAAMQVAERVHSLAQEQDDSTLIIWAYNALGATHYCLGHFESARQYAMRGIQIWRSRGVPCHPEDVDTPVVGCLCYNAFSEWHLGEIASCQAKLGEAIWLAKELNDMHALAQALGWAAILAQLERKLGEVERLTSEIIELSTRQNFAYWLAVGVILRGWARSASGNPSEGISCIEDGIRDYRAGGIILGTPYYLALKAEALHLANRTPEALEAIKEADALVEKYEEWNMRSRLHGLRAVFLAALGAEETQIEASFQEAIRIAKEQKSVSLAKRAEATYAEYRRQKASGLGGHGFRLPL